MQIVRHRRTAVASLAVFAGLALTAAGVLNAQPAGDPPAKPATPRQGPGGERGERGERGPGGEQRGGQTGPRTDAPVSVERSMKGIGRALSRLAKQVTDPAKKVENVGLISDAQKACVAARSGMPRGKRNEETDAAKKLAALVPYRKEMIKLEESLIAIEVALLDDKLDAAKAEIEKCLTIRKEGHDLMGVKDDE